MMVEAAGLRGVEGGKVKKEKGHDDGSDSYYSDSEESEDSHAPASFLFLSLLAHFSQNPVPIETIFPSLLGKIVSIGTGICERLAARSAGPLCQQHDLLTGHRGVHQVRLIWTEVRLMFATGVIDVSG